MARGDVGGQVRQRKRGIRGKAEMAKQREGHLEEEGGRQMREVAVTFIHTSIYIDIDIDINIDIDIDINICLVHDSTD